LLACADLKVLPVEHDLGRVPTRIDTPDLPAIFRRKCHGRLVRDQNRGDRDFARHRKPRFFGALIIAATERSHTNELLAIADEVIE
jgi:hypothetical protein